jgi:hypothetical protein
MVLAFISVPAGFVAAEQEPHSEEAAESSATESSEEEADAGGTAQTAEADESTTEDGESATEDEEATETDSSAEGGDSGSDESASSGEPTKEPPPPPPLGEITVDLVKDNDADGDGTFTDSEEASEEGQDVTFQVVITNTSDVDMQIMGLTDAFGETTIDQLPCLTAGGQSVLGMWLDPDESVTCTFTVQDYAPPAGESLVDTVEVIVCAKGSDDRASDSDTSIVTTSEVLGGIVTPPRPGVQPPAAPGEQVAGAQALAVTGSELAWMALLAVSLLAAGIALLYSARSGTLKQRA